MNLKRLQLPLVVFITGACVLIIEITATRILSPYFGNTIFSVSSVITVILIALSLGYYLGGRLSDKHPTENYFYKLILYSGFSVFLLFILYQTLLPLAGYQLSIIYGPMIASLVLFLLPGFI